MIAFQKFWDNLKNDFPGFEFFEHKSNEMDERYKISYESENDSNEPKHPIKMEANINDNAIIVIFLGCKKLTI